MESIGLIAFSTIYGVTKPVRIRKYPEGFKGNSTHTSALLRISGLAFDFNPLDPLLSSHDLGNEEIES